MDSHTQSISQLSCFNAVTCCNYSHPFWKPGGRMWPIVADCLFKHCPTVSTAMNRPGGSALACSTGWWAGGRGVSLCGEEIHQLMVHLELEGSIPPGLKVKERKWPKDARSFLDSDELKTESSWKLWKIEGYRGQPAQGIPVIPKSHVAAHQKAMRVTVGTAWNVLHTHLDYPSRYLFRTCGVTNVDLHLGSTNSCKSFDSCSNYPWYLFFRISVWIPPSCSGTFTASAPFHWTGAKPLNGEGEQWDLRLWAQWAGPMGHLTSNSSSRSRTYRELSTMNTVFLWPT